MRVIEHRAPDAKKRSVNVENIGGQRGEKRMEKGRGVGNKK